jgi:hypothetical protein
VSQGPSVDYELEVTLDAASHQLSGSGIVTLHNRTQSSLTRLYLHLYLNAFESSRSVFFRTEARARSGQRPTRWGRMDVLHFARVGSADELWPADAHSPDDPEDRTDIAVDLRELVAPGQVARFEMRWTAQLPALVERTGFAQEFHFLGQWFPKLAKLEPDGSWAHFTFHPHSEFYANFGNYRVNLDVAPELVVGATGQRVAESTTAGRKRLSYAADAVHDFAWSAWRGFETRQDELSGVTVTSLYPPGFARNAERALEAVAHGLAFYGARFGPYPYPTLTIVHPPDWARAAGGMEYPGLITTAGPWYTGWLSNGVAEVTLHELGHQWFQGLLASDESRWPFLDEGFTTFVEARALAAQFGAGKALQALGLGVSATAYYRWWGNDTSAPIAQAAAKFTSFDAIGALVYSRTATLLETLSRSVVGFDAVFEQYVRAARFTHPSPQDFLSLLEARLGTDVRLQTERALFERGSVDFSIVSARSTPQGAGHLIEVQVARSGELEFGVEIELRHTDGSVVHQRWDGHGTNTRIGYVAQAPLEGVVVDPQLRVLLDADPANNAKRLEPSPQVPLRRRVLRWLNLCLRGLAP